MRGKSRYFDTCKRSQSAQCLKGCGPEASPVSRLDRARMATTKCDCS
jgi:hypothetical protein